MPFTNAGGEIVYGTGPTNAATANAPGKIFRELRRRDHRFFSAMSIIIACTVFVGFSRTFYLKNYFHAPQLPLLLSVHGILSTCWILLFVAQNLLIAGGQIRLHRRLGWAGAVLALVLVPLDTATALHAVSRGVFAPARDAYSALLTFNFRNIFEFAVLIAAAIYQRRNGESHKRLALLATVALFADPTIGRLPGISLIAMILLFAAFHFVGPVYDLLTRGRIHPAYLWGVPFLSILSPFAGLTNTVAQTHVWHSFVDSLLR